MAAGVATNNLSLAEAGARLRADRVSEQRRRGQAQQKNLPGLNRVRAAILGPEVMNASPSVAQFSATQQTGAKTVNDPGEAYQKAFRQRQLRHQIGESVGVVLGRQDNHDGEQDDFKQLQQAYAEDEAELLMANQLGHDQRSAAAKRAAQAALKASGLKDGLDHLANAAAKEVGGLTMNAISGVAEVIDADGGEMVDFGLVTFITFVQNQIQTIRTIFSPPPPPPEEARDLKEMGENFVRENKERLLDMLFPRLNLHTPSGLTSVGKVILQWFALGLIIMAVILSLIFYYIILYWPFLLLAYITSMVTDIL